MSDSIIQANASLVRNGDFTQPLNVGWTRGATNPAWTKLGGDEYEGKPIRYLETGNASSASQLIEVPKDLRADARYVLSFLCESWHDKDGRLEVSVEGSSEPAQVITLPAGTQLNDRVSKERYADQRPMVFKPEKYEAELTLALKKDDKVRVSVISPASQDDEYQKVIRVTRIKILLHLGPLVLKHLTVDKQTLPPGRPLYLCLGAVGSDKHTLGFVPAPGNAWLDTHASLTSEDNPLGGIIAIPDLGEDHPLDERWSLDCPLIDGDDPHEFSFNLLSKYTAEAYPIRASLGHHRLEFGAVEQAAYYPVLEYKQSVRVGVQVVSHYNTKEPLGGRVVTWTLQGQRQGKTLPTNEEGWSFFDYTPDECGDVVITASVVSLYYASGVFTQTFDVRVLATDPLDEVLAIIDGKEAHWHEKTGYPNRGSQYPVTLKVPDDSPLRDTELWLLWEGDPAAELGVTVSPQLNEPVPVRTAELTWTLTCDDRLDGKFDLLLGCSKLLLPSRKKPMSLARNVVEIGEVREANKSPVVDEGECVLLMVQVVHVVTSGPGDPVVNALVDWVGPNGTVSAVTGAGGWASVLDTPKKDGPYQIIARVRAHVDMQPVEYPFTVTALATSPWKDKVEFHLDNEPVDRAAVGIACLRGKSHTFRVTPTVGSPVKDKPMTLSWRAEDPGFGLTIGAPKDTVQGGKEWQLNSEFSTSRSGLFALSLTSDGLPGAVREFSGRLLSENLADEGHVVLDQVSATVGNQTLYPCLGAVHRYNFLPNVLSSLIGLDLNLTWSGTSAGELGATVLPALNRPQAIDAGGAAWLLDFTASQTNGQFSLALELPQLKLSSTANVMQLAHNKVRIAALHEAAVDPVVGQDRAWQWVRVISSVTRQPVAHVPVKWTARGTSSVVETDASGCSGYPLAPTTAQPHDVEALVFSPYEGYEDKRAMTVSVLASDPWKELVVQFDRQSPQLWGAKTYFPRRKGEHRIELSVPEGSPLLDQYVTLGLTGTGPAELDVRFVPSALGVPRLLTREGLNYTLKGGDLKDGSFSLHLAASRLTSLSPANALSLGTGSQVLKIIASSSVHQTLDWEQELSEQVTVVSAVSGKPMVDRTVTWRSPDLGMVATKTDFYGVAKIRFKPVTVGAGVLTATVGDEVYSESIDLTFVLNDPREIQSLTLQSQSAYPGEEIEAQAIIVSSLSGKALADVEVMWALSGVSLAPTRTDAEGKTTVRFKGRRPGPAVLDAMVRGGQGGWDMATSGFTVLSDSLEITALVSDQTTLYLGEEAAVRASVVYRRHGVAAQSERVDWSFPALQLSPSYTDADGVASLEFKPTQLETHALVATAEGDVLGQSLGFTVLDPLTDPTHAKIHDVRASRNPIGVGEFVTFSAIIVSSVTQEPMRDREVFISMNGASYVATRTDYKGEVSRSLRGNEAGTLSFSVEVRNPGATVERKGVSVVVLALSVPETSR